MNSKFLHILILCTVFLIAATSYPAAAATPQLTRHASNQVISCGRYYTVRAGDTLSAIAARCGVSLWSLISVNGLRITSIIYPGQQLIIPGASATTTQGTTSTAPLYTGCTNPYIVRPGDYLSAIAARCGVSVYALKQWNGLYSDLIWAGQALYLRTVVPVIASPSYYSGVTAVATPTPYLYISPEVVDSVAPQPTPTPAIESPISPWW